MTRVGDNTDVIAGDSSARIFEAGYRPYRGVRLGVRHSVWALARHTFERIMGLKRPARYKVLPFLSVIIAYLPAVAFIGIVALVPDGGRRVLDFVPGPGRYYGFITAAIILFTSLAAPEALCPDKRSRFLGIYLASPLNRSTYLLAKAMAVVTVLLLVTLGPPLLLLFGLALQNDGPRSFGAFMGTLAQIFVAGISLSLMLGAVSLAIPSLTDRRGFASAGSLLLFLGSGAITSVITFGLHGPRNVLALGLNRLPFELALRIFTLHGLPTGPERAFAIRSVPGGAIVVARSPAISTPVVVLASVGLTVIAAAVTWWRVVGLEVTR